MTGYNQERTKYSAPPLSLSQKLTSAAQGLATYMARTGVLSHTGPGGNSVGDRLRAAGYSWSTAGENIALGYRDAAAVVAGWAASPGHHKNMINPAFHDAGFAMATDRGGGIFWVCDLGAGGIGILKQPNSYDHTVFSAGPLIAMVEPLAAQPAPAPNSPDLGGAEGGQADG